MTFLLLFVLQSQVTATYPDDLDRCLRAGRDAFRLLHLRITKEEISEQRAEIRSDDPRVSIVMDRMGPRKTSVTFSSPDHPLLIQVKTAFEKALGRRTVGVP
jgi:hypothetical protein